MSSTLYLTPILIKWRKFLRHTLDIVANIKGHIAISRHLRESPRPRTYRDYLLVKICFRFRLFEAIFAFRRRRAASIELACLATTPDPPSTALRVPRNIWSSAAVLLTWLWYGRATSTTSEQ